MLKWYEVRKTSRILAKFLSTREEAAEIDKLIGMNGFVVPAFLGDSIPDYDTSG